MKGGLIEWNQFVLIQVGLWILFQFSLERQQVKESLEVHREKLFAYND